MVNRLLEYTRGGVVNVLGADLVLRKGVERVQMIDPFTAGRKVTLPDFSILKLGGPHFYVANISTIHSMVVESHNAEQSFTLTTEKVLVLSTFRNVGTVAWFAQTRDLIGVATGGVAP